MRRVSTLLIAVAVVAMATSSAMSQPPRGEGGERERGPREGGERGPREGGPRDAAGFIERLMEHDKNKDGKLSKDELPERLQTILGRADENKDDVLDKAELEKMAARFGQGGGRGGPEGRGGGPEGRGGRGGRGGQGGPPNPEQIVEHAMTFDADKDGKLSKDELLKFAQEMVTRRPTGRDSPEGRGGRGGPGGGRGGPGGRGGQRPERPDGEGGQRPERPERPDA